MARRQREARVSVSARLQEAESEREEASEEEKERRGMASPSLIPAEERRVGGGTATAAARPDALRRDHTLVGLPQEEGMM